MLQRPLLLGTTLSRALLLLRLRRLRRGHFNLKKIASCYLATDISVVVFYFYAIPGMQFLYMLFSIQVLAIFVIY